MTRNFLENLFAHPASVKERQEDLTDDCGNRATCLQISCTNARLTIFAGKYSDLRHLQVGDEVRIVVDRHRDDVAPESPIAWRPLLGHPVVADALHEAGWDQKELESAVEGTIIGGMVREAIHLGLREGFFFALRNLQQGLNTASKRVDAFLNDKSEDKPDASNERR